MQCNAPSDHHTPPTDRAAPLCANQPLQRCRSHGSGHAHDRVRRIRKHQGRYLCLGKGGADDGQPPTELDVLAVQVSVIFGAVGNCDRIPCTFVRASLGAVHVPCN